MIKFENVSKTYDGRKYVLNNFSATFDDGEFVFVMGPSGAGKTTLTKLLLREERLSEGRLYFDKYKLHKLPDRKIPYLRRKMGYVFQDFRLFQNKTVYENVAFAMEVLGEPSKTIKKRVPIALEIVGLTGKERVMPKELSGGEKQRLCVARAIVNNPSVIVADEPTGNLDVKLAKEIMDLLVKISEYGKTVIVVTHAKELVEKYDKRVITIESGCLVGDTVGIANENDDNAESNTDGRDSQNDSLSKKATSHDKKREMFPDADKDSISTNGEFAEEIMPVEHDVDGIDEGSNLFKSFVADITENDAETYDEFGSKEKPSDNDVNIEYKELIAKQTALIAKRDSIKSEISSLLASGNDSKETDSKLGSLRETLDVVDSEIDRLDIKLGKYGSDPFDVGDSSHASSEKTFGGEEK